MKAITLRREHRYGVGPASAALDEELVARLRPLADMFTDEELDRIERGNGPLVLMLLDAEGLPVGGVITDRETGRRTSFQLPISGKAVA